MSSNIADILQRILSQQQPAPQVPASADFGSAGQAATTGAPQPLPPEDDIVSPNSQQPNPPDQRMEGYRRLLTNFTYSLGTGLEAATQGGRGKALRTEAGMGAILQTPMKIQQAQEAYKAQAVKEANVAAQTKLSQTKADTEANKNLMLPAQLQDLIAKTQNTQAKTSDISANRDTLNTTANATAQKNKFISTPQGLFDISGDNPTKVAGSEPVEFTVSEDIAKNFGVPDLAGAKVPTSTFNEIIKQKNPKLQLSPMQNPDGTTGLYSVNLETGEKIKVGDAKSGLLSPEEEAQKIRIASAAYNSRNPELDAGDVKYIADQVDNDPTGTILTKLVGTNQKLRQQVVHELNGRDSDLRVLTASTRQLGETAHELMPNFDHALEILNDNGVKQAMGPLGSRWQEFLAGKIGTSDPAFRGIDPATISKMNDLRTFVSLLQTGTARAHVGARGSAALQTKFENMFNSNKMDATTLRDALSSTKDFLGTYDRAVYGMQSGINKPTPVDGAHAAAVKIQGGQKPGTTRMSDASGKLFDVPNANVALFKQNGYH